MAVGARRYPLLAHSLLASAVLLSAVACGDDDDETPGAAGSAGTGGSPTTMGAGGAGGAAGNGAAGNGAAGNGAAGGGAGSALTSRPVAAQVISTSDNVARPLLATVSYATNLNAQSEPRPLIAFLPGWGGVGDVGAAVSAQAEAAAKAGYIAVSIGFHQVPTAPNWVGDLAESAAAALGAVCADAALPSNCAGIALAGQSYGGTQTHPVTRYLRAVGYDGAAGREVVAFLSQDAGYTLYYADPKDAQLALYSVAMIENTGDTTFPPNGCDYDNCGAANRVAFHLAEGEASTSRLLAMCPAGGEHGVRTTYPAWDTWVLDALKTMLHTHHGIATFAGYEPPTLALGPNGVGEQGRCTPLPSPTERGPFGPRPGPTRLSRAVSKRNGRAQPCKAMAALPSLTPMAARYFTPADLVALPRLSANGAVALGHELMTVSKKASELPSGLQKAQKRLTTALADLEGQLAAGGTAEASPYDSAVAGAADTKLDRSWGAMNDFVQSFLRLPHDDQPVRADAQRVIDAAFGQGLRFLQLPYKLQWVESKIRLKRLEDKNTTAALDRLGGTLFLQTVTKAHDEYGVALNLTVEAELAPKVTRTLREALEAFTAALRVYVMQAAAFALEDDASKASAEALLAPIARWQVGRRVTTPADEGDAHPPAPGPAGHAAED